MSQTSNEKNWFEKVVDSAGDIASKVGEGVGNIAGKVGDGVGEIVDKIGDEIKEIKEKRERESREKKERAEREQREKDRKEKEIREKFDRMFSPNNFIDKGAYIELICPIVIGENINIHRIEKVVNLDRLTWNESLQYARNLNLGGLSNWRVPTLAELIIIYNIKDIWGIEDHSDDFWSYTTGRIGSTRYQEGFVDLLISAKFEKIDFKSIKNTYRSIFDYIDIDYSTYACILGFHNGKVGAVNKSESRYVRCVQ